MAYLLVRLRTVNLPVIAEGSIADMTTPSTGPADSRGSKQLGCQFHAPRDLGFGQSLRGG